MHLRVAGERLADRYGVAVLSHPPKVGYRETIRSRSRSAAGTESNRAATASSATWWSTSSRCRAAGASIGETITGGVVPRNYIPSVEEGVAHCAEARAARLSCGRHRRDLIDGSYHTVDSSDMAFQLAGRLAMVEGMPQCHPVLLEPIHHVEVVCPSDATAKINAIVSGRRGQLLGFDARAGLDRLGRGARPDAGIRDR